MLAEIHRQGVKAVFSIEYEYNWDNSLPDIAQSVKYFDQSGGLHCGQRIAPHIAGLFSRPACPPRC